MISSANRFGMYTYLPNEMLTDVKKGVWEELTSKKPIDNYRRNLQKNFVENLIAMLPTSNQNSGAVLLLSAFLGLLQASTPKNLIFPQLQGGN